MSLRLVLLTLLCAQGCGAAVLVSQGQAAGAIERAQHAGTHASDTYEAYSAAEYLEKSREEIEQGQYQDAMHFAEQSEHMARAAAGARP